MLLFERRSALATAIVSSLASCSLMGLDDFHSKPCKVESDCERAKPQLNREFKRCGRVECHEGLCEWAGVEQCDGKDDNCNDFIDDGIEVTVRGSTGSLEGPPSVAHASAAPGSPTFVIVGSTAPDGARGFVITNGIAGAPRALRYDSAIAGDYRCPRLTGEKLGGMACNFTEVALAADSQHLVFATINALDCAKGQVRIGFSDIQGTDPFRVWLGARPGADVSERNNIAAGVDLDDSHCTGRSLKGEGSEQPVGATRPAVASLGTAQGAPSALALWLASPTLPNDASQCGVVQSLVVEALAVHVSLDHPLQGLDGFNQSPLALKRRASRLAPPAVVAVTPSDGPGFYLVAFVAENDSQHGIQLTKLTPNNDTLSETELRFIDAPEAEQVVLAQGRTTTDGPEIGIAWTSGCGPQQELHLGAVSLLTALPPQEILKTPAPDSLFQPQLLHAPEGLSEVPPNGGWLLLWTQQSLGNNRELWLARASEQPFQILNQVALRSGNVGYPVPFLHTVLTPESSTRSMLGYGLISNDSNDLRIDSTPDWCR